MIHQKIEEFIRSKLNRSIFNDNKIGSCERMLYSILLPSLIEFSIGPVRDLDLRLKIEIITTHVTPRPIDKHPSRHVFQRLLKTLEETVRLNR